MDLPEIILIDKPKGMSSYDIIRKLGRKYPGVKMGHAGTLDPLATGLMIIGSSKGTKKLDQYLKLPKSYMAKVLIGIKTDTGDLEGHIVAESKVSTLDKKKVEKVLTEMIGKITLPVPAYSAIKVGGKPLYKRARSGEKFVPPKKEMLIIDVELISIKDNILDLKLNVGSGTYIRSIAEEIGKRLGHPATLKSLRRTKIGNFDIKNAPGIDEFLSQN